MATVQRNYEKARALSDVLESMLNEYNGYNNFDFLHNYFKGQIQNMVNAIEKSYIFDKDSITDIAKYEEAFVERVRHKLEELNQNFLSTL
jgi:hypothetical protein